MTPRELRLEILRKHARLGPNGQVSRCSRERGSHPGGKVIFRTRAKAERAAAELANRTCALEQDVYECRHAAHFHLTKADVR